MTQVGWCSAAAQCFGIPYACARCPCDAADRAQNTLAEKVTRTTATTKGKQCQALTARHTHISALWSIVRAL